MVRARVLVGLCSAALVVAPPAEAASAAGSGGAAAVSTMPKGDLPGWKQVFADDFTTPVPVGGFPGTAYSSRWSGYSGFRDTSGKGVYTPSKVLSVVDGALRWTMRTVGGTPLVAAPVPKLPGYGQTYGRYSVRFRTGEADGYKLAFLLWPDSEDWGDGELDWPEVGSLGERPSPASLIPGTPYSSTGARFLPATRVYAPTTTAGWHVATTEWSPGKVVFSWDGKPVTTVTGAVPRKSMHWVLQAETVIGGPKPAAAEVGRIDLDWAVAYRYAPS